ncbi:MULTISPECIES: MECDP-synthase [Marinobacter]|jgi:pimeloyl-ACP methyl ester carboxylesterase|uniref:MECDP-synthase n=1 Tax=Marinobacter TaxID=2742 RepID=UPI0007D8F89C|nr:MULTISPECIES: MECDP-synthase [unclassified Marinobacter]MBL3825195.1 MECDP-synthase [Marinobacter sp. MC3]MBL3893601.1 MECDP-synthase [Marinobacter sp. MW3]OAN93564.1 MECDP-synthase [Marinobacter sp. EhC06]OAN94839.1 MECDP-synthase [Marinobacter sp. EhN04]
MFKKTLISLAVASSVGLTGCFDSGETGANANPDYQIEDTTIDKSIVRPIYDPNPIASDPKFPINADLILLLGATQSANYDFTGLSGGTSPADDAVNDLSGFSTSGAFTLKFDGSLNPVSVQAGATVFLLPVNVKDAVEGVPEALPNTNPSGIDQANPFDLASIPNFRADVVSIDGGSDNAIRIVPLEPLAEGQKYLVVATNNIVGADGQPIERSVQDVNLADGVLGNPALANVKSILQASDTLANAFLAQAIPQDTPKSALAYTFTTNSDTDVLRAMMAPAAFGSALGQKVGFTAQLKAVRDNYPTLNFSQLTTKLGEIAELAADLQAGDIDPSDLDAQELAAITALATVRPLTEPGDLQAAIGAEIGDTLHLPVPRPSFFNAPEPATDLATIQVLAADPTNAIANAAQQVQVSQGAIALPYFQSLPGETGAGIVTGSWSGSTSLEDDLNENLAPGQTIFSFLRDIDGTLNVNGYFPFPEQNATTTVPVVVFQPVLDGSAAQPASCVETNGAGKPEGVTIFQHGITVDRSVSMLPAILLAQSACQTVVAIDQPLHGLAGATNGTVAGLSPLDADALTTDVEAAIGLLNPNDANQAAVIAQLNALISADYIGERHFGYTANASLQPVEAPLADISSGSLFINPLNMMNSRDNLRQGVVDLLNVAASIQTFDLNKDFAPGDLAGVPVNFIGHSLGGISGTVFASLANDATLNATLNGTYAQAGVPLSNFTFPTLNSVVLHNTSGQVTRLIENSPAFSGQVLGGLANAGVTQGTSDFESFFYVFQSISDAGDPVNFAKGLGASTSNLLVTEVVGDTTVPNEANVNPLSPAFSAPLTGTEPLMALLDLGAGGTNLADGADLNLLQGEDISGSATTPVAVFFDGSDPCSTANHGTFVAPQAPNDACPGGFAVTSDAFTVMVTQTAQALSGGNVPASPNNIDALGTSPTLANALDQDEQAAP